MNAVRIVAAAMAVAAALATSACVRTDDGVSVAAPPGTSVEEEAVTAAPTRSEADPTTSATGTPGAPGILETSRAPVPAGTVTCTPDPRPPAGFVAAIDDATAPQIVLAVPEGWTSTEGTDAVAGTLAGPKGMTATITIAPTDLGADAAFRRYADEVMAKSSISSVSVLPGELCDYSGQKLMGAWSNSPQNAVSFYDRLAHVWTNTADYLVVVHVEAPAGVDELDAASDVLTGDFEVRIP
ncbi:hypothetical protein [Mycolicibacterium sediminis]|uniref:Lipoprotein LpqN n=1 Tax=Mycolicibacterium sediminis TaxID=1286180 RepID=A0A7I7QPJ0_9MYCO|nr:hypothetical protein [Mycolicibacterium sediminis]BBY28308.1 hypothetical protein MSEDJ_24040 [Mycolicibacterium sediminis]